MKVIQESLLEQERFVHLYSEKEWGYIPSGISGSSFPLNRLADENLVV